MTAMTEEKKAKIRATRALTREKRAGQSCRVFTLKIQANKLTVEQRDALRLAFLQAKWLRNHIVGLESISDFVPAKTVPVRLPDGSAEARELSFLGSQVRQSILSQVWNDVLALSRKKARGGKVGRLKFKSSVNSLDLKQHGVTYKFKSQSKVKIQGLPGLYRLRGASQLKGFELANAKLLRKADGYYLAVTAFEEKKEPVFQANTVVGLDMGVKTHITLSDGSEYNVLVEETQALRRAQRKLSRQVKGSKRYTDTRRRLQREYLKMDNKKNDAANKLVAELMKHELVFMQNEQLASWRKRNGYVKAGRRLQHSILGRVKAKLIHQDRVVVLRSNAVTTQTCKCGVRNKHELSQRVYHCPSCGYRNGRDVHAAQNMVRLGASAAPVRSQALVEDVLDWDSEDFQRRSVKREALLIKAREKLAGSNTASEAPGSLVRV